MKKTFCKIKKLLILGLFSLKKNLKPKFPIYFLVNLDRQRPSAIQILSEADINATLNSTIDGKVEFVHSR